MRKKSRVFHRMVNDTLADIFQKMSIYLEMLDIPFKPRAYERAALEIRQYPEDLSEIYKKRGLKGLDAIPSIGKGIAEKIEEYLKTGHIREYEILKKKMPVEVSEITAIEGLGPKMLKTLYKELKIKNIADLEKAARLGKIRLLPGFGRKTEENILQGIAFLKQSGGRKILGYVLPVAQKIEESLKSVPGVQKTAICGSLRRMQDTIGDIDLLVITTNPKKVNEAFIALEGVQSVYTHGPTRSSVRLKIGIDADLRVVSPEMFGSALQYFTGDKSHNVALRKRARAKKMKLNEYGLFRGNKRVAGKTEEEIYQALGMQYIPPEIRTNSGEIEAAEKQTLPHLLPYGSVKGDLQVHSSWTDGSASIQQMAQAARSLGHSYIAITDHTQSLAMTGGLNEKKLRDQRKEIDRLNASFKKRRINFRILQGAEVNILKDGSLDIPLSARKRLDIVGIAVHSHFKMSRSDMTRRLIRAIQQPEVHILYHPTGRIINKRPPYVFDFEAVCRAAKKQNVALEIDAYPDRTDLHDDYIRTAIKHHVKLVINTDAHAPEHLRFIKLGEAQARRGWTEKKDILNTMELNKLLAHFGKRPPV